LAVFTVSVWGSFNEAKAHILELYPDDVYKKKVKYIKDRIYVIVFYKLSV
jgi:hypothetical protein